MALSALPAASHTAGMPELAFAGLSEQWLLKECGQRHWQGIAQALGLALPRFEDASGRTAYAAFTAIHLDAAGMDGIVEHQRFELAGEIGSAGRSRHLSRHTLSSGGVHYATLRMLSAFVQRLDAGNNQSVARASIKGATPCMDAADPDDPGLLQMLGQFRRGRQDAAACVIGDGRQLRLAPSPSLDFNGANFMYFAAFQAMVERAEWAWFPRADLPRLEQRHMYFHGNVNVGDEVIVRLAWVDQQAGSLHHHCQLLRASDGKVIADVTTRKRKAGAAGHAVHTAVSAGCPRSATRP